MTRKEIELLIKVPYGECILYPSIEDGIKRHAETYSFNIESELFNQLTKEQQKLWREEIEQACISGGEAGIELARDIRYKENLEIKEVDLKYKKGEKIMTNIISKKATEMYPADAQNSLQFRTGFIKGAKWMKEQMINEVWHIIVENISEVSEELMLEQTTSIEIANKLKESLEKLF